MTKICVYAISKNEEKNVDAWFASMSEADYIVVLDTGSTDDTVRKLKLHPEIIVEQKIITPWRFDTARNESMKLIPEDADICVCVDLDERYEPGWADILRDYWQKDTEKAKYLFNWNHDEHGNPIIQIWCEKIHSNCPDWYWSMPVHEVLTHRTKIGDQINMVYLPEKYFFVNHHADITKDRGQYLELMKQSLIEDPNNFMQNWYYGRELFFHGQYEESIKQLEHVKTMPWRLSSGQSFKYQRSAALTFLGHGYNVTGNYKAAEENYLASANMVDDVREPRLFLAHFYYERERWYACIDACLKAMDIPYKKGGWYEDIRNYREKPHDYMSIAYWNIGQYNKGVEHINTALEYAPNDQRLLNNKEFFTLKKAG